MTGPAAPVVAQRASSVPLSSDERLAAMAGGGDVDAFEELVRRYEGAIYRHLLRVVRRSEDAEDLTQEAFVHAWRAIGSFRPTGGFRPWLYRIATNAAMSHLRRKSHETVPLDELGREPADPRGQAGRRAADDEELAIAVRRGVAELPPDARALVSLRYADGRPLDEIARILGRKPGAIAVMLHRVRARLKTWLMEQEETLR